MVFRLVVIAYNISCKCVACPRLGPTDIWNLLLPPKPSQFSDHVDKPSIGMLHCVYNPGHVFLQINLGFREIRSQYALTQNCLGTSMNINGIQGIWTYFGYSRTCKKLFAVESVILRECLIYVHVICSFPD